MLGRLMPKKKTVRISGRELRDGLAAGARCMERYAAQVNALNVFPVPDGDTGTNMLLTMKSVVEGLDPSTTSADGGLRSGLAQAHKGEPSLGSHPDGVGRVAQLAARGALMGARGNSGVILSQFLSGFAQSLKDKETCDARGLAAALTAGSRAAYSAVSKPVEGTILTVMREAASAAESEALKSGADVIGVWEASLKAAKSALARTPEQLSTLRDAGVVDSGGQGLVVVMEGFLCGLKGQDVEAVEVEISAPAGGLATMPSVRGEYLEAIEGEKFGFCTQFMIEGTGIDLEALRASLAGMGNSAVVVGDATLAKVHIHTFEPDKVVAFGGMMGVTSQVKIDDIDKQHVGFQALHKQRKETPALAVVAVAWGEGFARLFRDLGCHEVVVCGRTMNPSAQEILEASKMTGSKRVAVLPNNSNVVLAARQAASMSEGVIHVIETRTLPQGVASALAYSPDVSPEQALRSMESAKGGVKTLEVTTAVRDSVVSGRPVKAGQVMALLDDVLI
ncbi:MAG: DAK2 domain-containing protein [SAR202 cluster bacterium]|nr:DAK2 domain-containing protein [SAR202 cluster bacterium]